MLKRLSSHLGVPRLAWKQINGKELDTFPQLHGLIGLSDGRVRFSSLAGPYTFTFTGLQLAVRSGKLHLLASRMEATNNRTRETYTRDFWRSNFDLFATGSCRDTVTKPVWLKTYPQEIM